MNLSKKIKIGALCLLTAISAATITGCSSTVKSATNLDSIIKNSIELSVKNERSEAITVSVGALNFGTIQPGATTDAQTLNTAGDHLVVVDGSNLVVSGTNAVVSIPHISETATLTIMDGGYSLL